MNIYIQKYLSCFIAAVYIWYTYISNTKLTKYSTRHNIDNVQYYTDIKHTDMTKQDI